MSFLSAQGQIPPGSFTSVVLPAGAGATTVADNLLASDLVLPVGYYILSASIAVAGAGVTISTLGFTKVTGTPAIATAFSDIVVTSLNPSLCSIYRSDGETGFNVFAIGAGGAWTSSASTLSILRVV